MSAKTTDITRIVSNLDLAKDIQTFNQLLDTPPKQEWVKQHPLVKVEVNGKKQPLKYIPVGIYEKLLRNIFQQFDVEIRESKEVFNSKEIIVRIHYLHPITSEWRFLDGVGAAPMQTDRGAKAMDAASIKYDAVQKASPAAKSFAMKDALGPLGRIFGSDLNSDAEYEVGDVYAEPLPEVDVEKAEEATDKCVNEAQLNDAYKALQANYTMTTEADKVFMAKAASFKKTSNGNESTPEATPKQREDGLNQAILDGINNAKSVSTLNAIYKDISKEGIDPRPYLPLLNNRKEQLKNEQ